ncbi:uncharacterized protein LOC100165313 [Acyrthosiphon pisum]|uniref:Uncharacterized protein n=1 Tax=Acyrthosiphon pisum TaxID=7029 RepID=A0A8R2JPI5_ACYPI|nr:uncharacterized protein LOC100165313 [Acyrthosiphon pisum]XP_003245282.1 uncharacterized protein LOC100165313 [Acyrthosiphon pisum]XP_003245283.1 uncharacterized protein LOC100165313 [Acyrthosiphon pisum]XP_029343933.1 uncharacterized protein LOC100165313 [Acyrthosiphon pisum]|eukprot:XP_001945027.2 PREDICTED: uncharacterized protein LOC100165313 [Acyrthosiphon pisum]
MTENKNVKKGTNDANKIILYVIFMITLLLLYCSDKNYEIENSIDYHSAEHHSYYSKVITSENNTKILTKFNDTVKEGYVVWNDNCRIPNISAYDKTIKSFIKKINSPKCFSTLPLTSVILDVNKWSYTFKINYGLHSQISKSIVNCCYSSIVRNELKFKNNPKDDDRYKVEPKCNPINDSEIIPKSVEYMMITCELRPNGDKLKSKVYKDIHAMVIDKGQRRFRNADIPDKPSVLIISIDSLSRLNLIRSMPITYRLLETHGFVSLEGYTKVADNTFPNVVPILTGMFVNQMTKRCWKSPNDEMDECPFLWKDFKERGYVTAYVEDEPSMGTYNFGKYGFRNAPTDYYSRPYMLAAERYLPVVKFDGMNFCLGPRSAPDRVYSYVEDFVRLHKRHGYFAVFWLNTFSHNDVNAPSAMDQRTAGALSKLLNGRLLDNAVTVVLSDHGLRFGAIRQTRVGWLEDRMPAFYARLPPGYVATRPDHFVALAANKHRLTSPFDLHLTLKQLLFQQHADDGNNSSLQATVADGCPTCRSLFHLADANRSCEQAGIAPHWCTCDEYEELDRRSRTAMDGGEYVVRQLNALLTKYQTAVQQGYACSYLSLRKTVSARTRVNRVNGRREYLLVVETLPGRSMFEVTVGQEDSGSGAFGMLGDISRINMYGFQSFCTDDWRLKKHCYCVKKNRNPIGS